MSIKWENPYDQRIRLQIQPSKGLSSQVWLGVAIVLFSSAASAETYPVSGVWSQQNFAFRLYWRGVSNLKQFGIDAS